MTATPSPSSSHAKNDESEYRIDTTKISEKDFAARFVCINTSGSVLTSGTKKDGDDYKIHLSSGYTTTINDKTLKTGTVSYIILK